MLLNTKERLASLLCFKAALFNRPILVFDEIPKYVQQQVIYEDIRDPAQVQQLVQLGVLAELLKHQSAFTVVYWFAKKAEIAETTIKRWIGGHEKCLRMSRLQDTRFRRSNRRNSQKAGFL